jgi:hypothetical protein
MKLLDIVAVTYNHGRKLNIFCDSLLEQYVPLDEWHCTILHDGSLLSRDAQANISSQDTQSRMQKYIDEYPDNFSVVFNAERTNIWGHDLRDLGLQQASALYVHITNVDNQYNYGWLQRVHPALRREGPDLLLWNISHSYREFELFVPELRGGQIDFCNYIMRTSIAKELGFPWRNFEADSAHISEFVSRYPSAKVHRMPAIFSTHN